MKQINKINIHSPAVPQLISSSCEVSPSQTQRRFVVRRVCLRGGAQLGSGLLHGREEGVKLRQRHLHEHALAAASALVQQQLQLQEARAQLG